MWNLGIWFSGGFVSATAPVILDDIKGLFNLNDPMILKPAHSPFPYCPF